MSRFKVGDRVRLVSQFRHSADPPPWDAAKDEELRKVGGGVGVVLEYPQNSNGYEQDPPFCFVQFDGDSLGGLFADDSCLDHETQLTDEVIEQTLDSIHHSYRKTAEAQGG